MNRGVGLSIDRPCSPIIPPPDSVQDRCSVMMTKIKMLSARVGATAIAAALALSPVQAKVKPIVDLSQSPAETGRPAPAPAQPAKTKPMIGPVDERTAEIGGGAIVLLALGAGAFALTRRKRYEPDEWDEEAVAAEPRDPLFDEPMFQHEPEESDKSAFDWNKSSPSVERQDGRREGESWVERAYRGPTPDNPSVSLKTRLKRAAFFDKREREAAAGTAAPVDPDAGLPEALVEQQETEAA